MTVIDEHPPPNGQPATQGRRRGLPRALAAIGNRRPRVADRWVARAHRRRRLQFLLAVVVILLAVGGAWMVWFSSIMAVQQVRVTGLSAESEVAGIGQVQTAAAIEPGTALVRVDTSAAQGRIAELPWIETVDVYRSWPNAIVIEVAERTPVAVVEEGEARRGVDASGVLFDPPGGLWLTDPVIRGNEAALPAAVAVVASLPEEIARRVRVVQAVSPDDIRLQLGNDAIVRWGNADEGEFKAQVLLALLPRRAQAYDVSAPQLPTTFGEKGPRD